jgi:zinc protease
LQTEGSQTTAAYDELAGMITFPDGGRSLIRQDGYQVTVEPTLWHKGEQAVALVDSGVPRALHIPLPERTPDQIPQTSVRTIDKLRAWTNRPVVWVPFLILLLLLVVLTFGSVDIPAAVAKGLIVAVGIGVVTFVRQQRAERKKSS